MSDNPIPSDDKDPIDQFRDSHSPRDEVEDEEDLWEGGFSGKAMYGSWMLAALITICLLVAAIFLNQRFGWIGCGVVVVGVWLYLIGYMMYRKITFRYQLTTQRFIHRAGLLKQTTDRIEMIDIDDVTVVQGIVERMLGVGTIKITSSDRSHPILLMQGIEGVKEVADIIDDTRRRERRRRSVHIESI